MKKSRLSIRTTLLVIIGALNICIAILVGSGVYKSWLYFHEVQSLKEGSNVINALYNANKNLSIERGAALSVMHASDEAAAFLQEDLVRSRRESDMALNQVFSHLQNGTNSALPPAINQVEEKYQALQKLRQDLDAALAKPLAERDLRISDNIFKTSTALVTEIQNLILGYSKPFQNIDAVITQQMLFKFFVWELAEYAGEEYAIIGKLIVEDKYPTREQQEQLTSLRGRIQYGWEIIRKFSLNNDLAETLLPYMEEAETHYFFTFDQIKDLFYGFRPISTGASYPISIEVGSPGTELEFAL